MARKNWKRMMLTMVLMLAMLLSGCKVQKVEQGKTPETESVQDSTVSEPESDQSVDTKGEPEKGLELIDGDEKEKQTQQTGLDWAVSGGGEDLSFEESETTEPTKAPAENPASSTNPTQPKDPTKPTEPAPTTKPTEPAPTTEPTKPTETAPATEPTKPTEPTPSTEPTTATEPSTEPTQPGGSTDSTEWGPLI